MGVTSAPRYEVRFASANDSTIDDATTLLEDKPLTLDEIRFACRRYGVSAQVFAGGRVFVTVGPDGGTGK